VDADYPSDLFKCFTLSEEDDFVWTSGIPKTKKLSAERYDNVV
jgi:hypothetical protein